MNRALLSKSLFPLLSLLILNACGVALVDDESEKPAAEAPAPEYRIEALAEPDQYDIRFREDLHVQMVSDQGILLQNRPGFFEGGKTYQFLLKSQEKTSQIQVTVPKDLVVASSEPTADQPEMSFRTSGRLFLSRETLLMNFDKPLNLEADEIISDGARIQNFYADSHAALGMPGRTGGRVKIKARKMSGRLWIGLRGENGGEGLQGEAWKTAAYTGLSYTGGTSEMGCRFYIRGGRGGDGKPGHIGQPGKPGGDSGSLYLDVNDVASLDLQIEKTPGHGGIGGKGGPGQPGGPGGASTSNYNPTTVPGTGPQAEAEDGAETLGRQFNRLAKTGTANMIAYTPPPVIPALPCTNDAKGPDGSTGQPGDQGPLGNEGGNGKVCRVHSDQVTCE